jgi:hypothetical protein
MMLRPHCIRRQGASNARCIHHVGVNGAVRIFQIRQFVVCCRDFLRVDSHLLGVVIRRSLHHVGATRECEIMADLPSSIAPMLLLRPAAAAVGARQRAILVGG